jgi:hypothetical protein
MPLEKWHRVHCDRAQSNAEDLVDGFSSPAGNVQSLGCSGQMVGPLMQQVILMGPFRQAVAGRDGLLQATGQRRKVATQVRLEWRDRIEAQQAFIRVVQQFSQCLSPGLCNANADVMKVFVATSPGTIPATRFV